MVIQNLGGSGSIGTVAPAPVPQAPMGVGSTPPPPQTSAPQTSGSALGAVSASQLQNVVDALNQSMQMSNRDLNFAVDHSTGVMVVKVTDSQTGSVITQIPSKQALNIAQAIDTMQQGLLLRQKA